METAAWQAPTARKPSCFVSFAVFKRPLLHESLFFFSNAIYKFNYIMILILDCRFLANCDAHSSPIP